MRCKHKIIFLLIFPILFLACIYAEKGKESSVIYFDSGFSLHQDTINLDVKGEMTHALKYRDKFYVLFQQQVLKYGGHGKRWLYIIAGGQVEKVLDCPSQLHENYIDFYVKNDSIILKPYMDEQSYHLDLNTYQWTEIDKTDDLIFEDEKFLVYSLNFGEWGAKTWFKDKRTGKEYILEATTPLVNKIDTTYFLSGSFMILKIENPLLLTECTDDITYENMGSTKKYYTWHGTSTGIDVVYRDTTKIGSSGYGYKSHIVTSFVFNNELLHIYETDTAIYIARHEKHKIVPIQKIAGDLAFFEWYYSYRCSNLDGNNELVQFVTKDKQVYGLLEVIRNEIHIHYIVNKAVLRPAILGAAKADSIFIERLNIILPSFDNLQQTTIDAKEQQWGSFDITPNHQIGLGDELNPNNYKIDTCRSYLILEDSIISNSVMYFGTKKDTLVRVVSMNWEYERDLDNPQSEAQAKLTFDNKSKFLIDYISKNVGKIKRSNKSKDSIDMTWKTSSGTTLYLWYNTRYYGIGLEIY